MSKRFVKISKFENIFIACERCERCFVFQGEARAASVAFSYLVRLEMNINTSNVAGCPFLATEYETLSFNGQDHNFTTSRSSLHNDDGLQSPVLDSRVVTFLLFT